MATFSVPDQVPPVAEDCEKLRKAMQGRHYLHSLNPTRSHPTQIHLYILICITIMIKNHMQILFMQLVIYFGHLERAACRWESQELILCDNYSHPWPPYRFYLHLVLSKSHILCWQDGEQTGKHSCLYWLTGMEGSVVLYVKLIQRNMERICSRSSRKNSPATFWYARRCRLILLTVNNNSHT